MRSSLREFPVAVLLSVALAGTGLAGDELETYKNDFKKAFAAANVEGIVAAVNGMGALDDTGAVDFVLEKVLANVDQFRFHLPEYKDPLSPPSGGTAAQQEEYARENARRMELRGRDDRGIVAIFQASKEALVSASDPKSREKVLKRMAARKSGMDVQVALVEVAAEWNHDAAAEEALVGLVGDRTQEVQRVAIRALGRNRSVKAVPALIDLLGKIERQGDETLADTLEALSSITGERFASASAWRDFWAIKGEGFDPERDRGSGESEAGTAVAETPTFFGTEVISKRIVFVIDVSGSMHIKDPVRGGEADEGGGTTPGGGGAGGGGGPPPSAGGGAKCPYPGCAGDCNPGLPKTRMRVERVKRELVRLVKVLDEDVRFNIIAFDTECQSWQTRALVPAVAANKAKAIEFVERFTYRQFTSTDLALEEAFENKEANTFYLLSDGSPYRAGGPLPVEPIYAMVEQKNKTRHVKIHTIGFPGSNTGFMTQIANMSGGKYVDLN